MSKHDWKPFQIDVPTACSECGEKMFHDIKGEEGACVKCSACNTLAHSCCATSAFLTSKCKAKPAPARGNSFENASDCCNAS